MFLSSDSKDEATWVICVLGRGTARGGGMSRYCFETKNG